MITSKNPVLRDDTFRNQAGPFIGSTSPLHVADRPDAMTIKGVISKGAILMLLTAFAFGFTWDKVINQEGLSTGLMALGGIGGFIISLVISFKPHTAPFLAPVFALAEGLLLGAISAWYESGAAFSGGRPSGYDGIVLQATLGTIAVFTAMLLLYRTRVIKVTQRFRAIVMTAMLGIVVVYMLTFLLSLFGTSIPMIHEGGAIGIGFSLIVIGIASMMLLVDFDTIERGVAAGAPKYMEWYGAFALLVTLIWIYLEMLRLLSKLRR